MTKIKYIRIEPKLHQLVKVRAAQEGMKIQEWAEKALTRFLKVTRK